MRYDDHPVMVVGIDLRVGKRLDDAPAEGPLEVAASAGGSSRSGRQRHLVDAGLRVRDGVVIEAREP
jgi:hypothetical protein